MSAYFGVGLVAFFFFAVCRNACAQGGSLDSSFQPGAGASYPGNDSVVRAVVVQPDGKILIGGNFTLYNNVARGSLARLNADGSLDAGFDAGVGGLDDIFAIKVQPDGKVLIGGTTTYYSSRNRFTRLNTDGSVDTTFHPEVIDSETVYDFTLQPDGKIIVAGSFSPGIIRLNADGTLDANFDVGSGPTYGQVSATALQPDGKIIAAGFFDTFNATVRNSVVRLNADGTVDASFGLRGSGAYSNIDSVLVQPDGKVVIAGQDFPVNGSGVHDVARLNSDGTLDPTFDFLTDLRVTSVILQPDGKLLVGGRFSAIYGINRNNIARLNSNGTVDTSFDPGLGPEDSPYAGYYTIQQNALALQPNGKVLIGGYFTSVDGLPRNNIARLNAVPSATLQFSAAAYSVTEGAGSVALTVTRSGSTADAVSVTYSTKSVSADSGYDYTGTSGTTLYFPIGSASQQILIPIEDDTDPEEAEAFTVTLTSLIGSAALGTPSVAIVTIVDDDAPPEITSPGTASGMVGQPFSFQIIATHNPTSFSATTAGVGLDGLTVDSATGVISGTPTVAGAFAVTLTAENAVGEGSATLTLTILPPPQPTVTVSTTTPLIFEGGDKGIFTLSLNAPATTDLIIHYKIGGAAFPSVQYKVLKGVKKIRAGRQSVAVKLVSYHDGIAAGTRPVKLSLLPGEGYIVGDPAKAKIKILDLD